MARQPLAPASRSGHDLCRVVRRAHDGGDLVQRNRHVLPAQRQILEQVANFLEQNFLARDKELSTFTSHMITVGATYELPPLGWHFVQKSTVNLYYDQILYDYQDFRDVREGGTPGTEPAYSYDAGVIRLFFSGWF